jgi:flagellar biosynthesis/type III secretory pathway chaperone
MTMTTEQMVIELKSVTYDLISLLERETQGLRKLEIAEYEQFVSEKSALSMQYEQLVVKLRARGPELRQLPQDDKAELRDLQAEFQQAARRNMTALQAAKATNERMVNAIVRAVNDKAKEECTTYNRSGQTGKASIGGYGRPTSKPGTSYSVNETL